MGLDEQWDLETFSPASWLKRHHQQLDIHTHVSLR
jgi:hypothetical protein